ncbi:hypothetical protein [Calothrix sp. NIES-2098]|uniref:hypothetical protein n=1 Tax=Calothrix sp. NIES-2098 TaxID=1954171 RepID=UPI0030DBC696
MQCLNLRFCDFTALRITGVNSQTAIASLIFATKTNGFANPDNRQSHLDLSKS